MTLKIVLGALLLVSLVAGGFALSANVQNRREIRQIKQDNKFLKKENLDLKEQNGILLEKVANRDSLVKRSMLTMDSLKTTLQELNKRNIVTVYENYTVVSSLNLDGQIRFLSGFLSEADSLSR